MPTRVDDSMGPRLVMSLLLASGCLGATYTVDADPSRPAGSLATISAAAERARAGDRVVIRPGVYRESVHLRHGGSAEAPIVFAAETPGTVIVTGADPLIGFQRVPGDEPLYIAPWRHVFAIDVDNGVPVEHHPDDAPLWGRAEQVIVDGRMLLPVESIAALRALARSGALAPPVKGLDPGFAGAFAVDRVHQSLWVWLGDGSDPRTHDVEASTRGLLLGINPFEHPDGVRNIHVKGIIFRYGATFPQRPAVWLPGRDNRVEDCLIESMAGAGVGVVGTLRNSVIRHNGHTGGGASGDGFVNEGNLWEGNAWKPINRDWDAGGAKITESAGGVLRGCTFRNNGGPGLWLDIDVRDVTIEQCVFSGNEASGVVVEISRGIRIINNLVLANAAGTIGEASWGDGGIKIAESLDVQVMNNTCIGNRDGITLREQGPRRVETKKGYVPFYCHEVRVERNLISASQQFALGLWYDNVFFGPHPDAAATQPGEVSYDPRQVGLHIDHNAYVGPAAVFAYGVPWRERHRAFDSLEQWRRGTGFDAHSRVMERDLKTEAGWKDAPDDPDQWMRRQLSNWLVGRVRPTDGSGG